MDDFFQKITSLFFSVGQDFLYQIIESLFDNAIAKSVLNGVLIILIFAWAISTLKKEEFFNQQSVIKIIMFIIYLGFFNWAISNPKVFLETLQSVIFLPSDIILQKVTEVMEVSFATLGFESNGAGGIIILINNVLNTLMLMGNAIISNMSFSYFFGIGFFHILLFVVLAVLQILFVITIMQIIIKVSIEVIFWLGFSIILLPLGFFKATRGMIIVFLKKIISLTLFKPCVFVLAYFNFNIVHLIISKLPNSDQIKSGIFENLKTAIETNFTNTANGGTLLFYFVLLIISSYIIFDLCKSVPDMINSIFNTQGGIADITEMGKQSASAISQGISGKALGGIAAATQQGFKRGVSGQNKNIVDSVIGGAISISSGGASNAISKGIGMLKKRKGGE
ncbi:hypothetical protein [Helicobacter anatolicus]|uniref:hypothetical protein n=1 Tax=Helicobacter anatolicus TaxID=2905874 RepID=UPI001E3AB1A6|nr:hypothetical protein [Helicobacter anatolicus]MCE3040027.1 hypothetical protein [Helicobacter anatolicus]